MCGRYNLKNAEALKRLIESLTKAPKELLPVRYNAAPTQIMPVVLDAATYAESHGEDAVRAPTLAFLRWGTRSMDEHGKPLLHINARSEKATFTRFSSALQSRRCLVPACGFYEWDRSVEPGIPQMFEMKDGDAFWMAGLWEENTDEFNEAFLVLTTEPNELVAPIHDRMPAILTREKALRWITPGPISKDEVSNICETYSAVHMNALRVSSVVNSARNDVPECVEPVLN